MLRRVPPVATLLVLAAVAAMVALGVWQLHRAEWKKGLLGRFEAARGLSPIAFPQVPPPDDRLLYRRADGFCLAVTRVAARAGESRTGQPGWRHIASCRTGAEGPGMQVDIGWSNGPETPKGWAGGQVTGVIGRDRDHRILLVADRPAPGLAPSAYPDPRQEPNNHLSYAVQWFAFAAMALVIYVVALRRRLAGDPPPFASPPPDR
jgi:surfeit locus 1 family protein